MLIIILVNVYDISFLLYKKFIKNILNSLLDYNIKKCRNSSIQMWKIFKKMWISFFCKKIFIEKINKNVTYLDKVREFVV
jgi:hypothetical protein